MRASSLAAVALLGAFTAAAQQPTFEGTVDFQMKGGDQGGATMVYSSAPGVVRLDIAGQRGGVATIIDPAKRTMTILMSAQKMYMTRPMPDVEKTVSESETKLTNTGKTDVVAGVKCEIWTGQGDHGTFTICAARDMGSFFAGMGGRREPPEWAKDLRGNFFPLRVVNGQGETVLLATKIEKKKLDKSVFTVPADFTKMEMPGGMGAPPPER